MQETHCTLTMQVPVELKDAFVQAAKAENMKTSQIILDFMQEYVQRVQASKPLDHAAMTAIVEQGNDTDKLIDVVIDTNDPELRERAAKLLRKVLMTEEQEELLSDAAYDAELQGDEVKGEILQSLIPASADFMMVLKGAHGSEYMRSLKLNYTKVEEKYGTNWLEA